MLLSGGGSENPGCFFCLFFFFLTPSSIQMCVSIEKLGG